MEIFNPKINSTKTFISNGEEVDPYHPRHAIQSTPEQNGIAERKKDMITFTLIRTASPVSLWGEANSIVNCLITAEYKTPFELWTGQKP